MQLPLPYGNINYSPPVVELTMTDYLTHTRNKSTIMGDYLIEWKLYPINEYGQIIDEEGIAIRSICDAVRFGGDQLFSPSGRVDIPSSSRVESRGVDNEIHST